MALTAEDNAYVDAIINRVKVNLGLSDYEANLVREINLELRKPLPTVQAGIESRVNILDMYRVKLANLIYSVNDKCSEFEFKYKSQYDPKFVQFTRAGRPNQQAVDSEIHMDPNMQDSRLTLNNFDAFKSLLFSYMRSIDSCKDSCMRKWGTL